MSKIGDRLNHYGFVPLADRIDITGMPCLSVDLRPETGGLAVDESGVVDPPHPFRCALFANSDFGAHSYTAEIRFMIGTKELALVGALTGRLGVHEVTPEHLVAAVADEQYAATMREWSRHLA